MYHALQVLLGHPARRSWLGFIAQSLDSLGQEVALEPAAHRLLAGAHDLGDLRRAQASLGGQQNHLGTRSPEAHVASSALQLFQFGELFGGKFGDAYGFHELLLRPHPTPLKIYLFVLRQGPPGLLP